MGVLLIPNNRLFFLKILLGNTFPVGPKIMQTFQPRIVDSMSKATFVSSGQIIDDFTHFKAKFFGGSCDLYCPMGAFPSSMSTYAKLQEITFLLRDFQVFISHIMFMYQSSLYHLIASPPIIVSINPV